MTPILVFLLVQTLTAGNLDSPGPPSQGSGMYSIRQIYDYLLTGSPLTVQSGFQQPPSGPAPTMVTLRDLGDDVKAQFDQCDAAPWHVTTGKKFFCTQSGLWGVQTGTAVTGTEGLLKTGQTTVYRTGDDGTYQKGIDFNYTDNNDGTVTDNVTGLMWAKDGNGEGCANGTELQWTQSIDWANNLVFAGYSDWRLPNVRELYSILHLGTNAPAISSTYFPNTQFHQYHTSTTSATNTYLSLQFRQSCLSHKYIRHFISNRGNEAGPMMIICKRN